jgi:polyferredoxin
MVIDHGFMEGFRGKMASDSFEVGHDLDGVSGATLSSEGIANAVRKAAYQISVSELGLTVQEQHRSLTNVESIIILGLFAAIFIGIKRKLNWIRPLVLVASVFVLGFWLNSPIALGNLASLVSGNAPSFMERPFWHLLIIGTLLITLILGRNIYCYWLCPFGAVQEGLHKVLPIFRYKTSPKLERIAQKIRWVLIWLALMTAFIMGNPSRASFEPFSAFFKAQANTGQWFIMILVLIIAVPVYRFWCRFFCPVGAVLDLVSSFKSLLGKKESFAERIYVKSKPKGCMGSGSCTECVVNCHQTQNKKHPEEKQTFFMAVLVMMLILVFYTVILNMGLLS